MSIVTFGRIGNEKNWKDDKKIYFDNASYLLYKLSYEKINYKRIEEENELEFNEILNKKIKEFKKNELYALDEHVDLFMDCMGLSFKVLDKKEKEEIRNMEFTYENWKNKSLILMNDYINRNKNICPPEIKICFDDICFPMFVQMSYESNFESNNFLKFIRDYFLLDDYKEIFEGLRDENLYNNIRKQMIDLYPILKEKYGMNKYLEKFLSYIIVDTDYGFEFVANILNNYSKKTIKIDENEPLKYKEN